ncbi:DNA glycosylase AlkZ-like family protein [Streptomyces sp. t39]|uniref:DNA glycosylase AlkZ-like family protein n=1 Tax=Streptomyces sp. t39 TaxID=1828156 RepID=UPI002905983B|nr:crosslink repair DNA glycosylase YcaQ family protein [Streptomyces sp. t39]
MRGSKGRTWTGNQAHRTFLADGFLAGIWELTESGDTATLTVRPFDPLTRAVRDALGAEAERTLTLMSAASRHDIRFADA